MQWSKREDISSLKTKIAKRIQKKISDKMLMSNKKWNACHGKALEVIYKKEHQNKYRLNIGYKSDLEVDYINRMRNSNYNQ